MGTSNYQYLLNHYSLNRYPLSRNRQYLIRLAWICVDQVFLTTALHYKQKPDDPRVWMELSIEERKILQQALGIE